MNALILPIFVALPLAAIVPMWLKGWHTTALAWLAACMVLPWLVFALSIAVLVNAPVGYARSFNNVRVLLDSLSIAAASWLLLTLVSLVVGLRKLKRPVSPTDQQN